ncbi:class I SAM-dependent methyltransferase [Roseomonas sp. AR75]|uniref:class I SAM-dependent methyltransferase n=1 Tax=Roseomonas sp. AR75 TaxID=2562311 RepID=UPI0010C05EB0|nr:class I SAM-dependent methyltransferase [Roseomonas sp. AR75]
MTQATGRNFDLKEEIRAYWSDRAPSFDSAAGHRIGDADAAAWHRLLAQGLGPLQGRSVLDLACGTGEVSRMLLEQGAKVTGVDFAEPMLDRAHAKLARRGWSGRLADVETLATLPDGAFDGAVTRHLVWTLTDPAAAFAAWRRVLKPGGRLLVVDGDFVGETLRGRLLRRLARALGGPPAPRTASAETHQAILARVHYSAGLSCARLTEDLLRAGFAEPRPLNVTRIYLRGLRDVTLAEKLRLLAPTRFALSARKPA